MPTNIIESSQELSDKDFFCLIIILLQSLVICNYNLVTSTWVYSIRILSSVGVYYPAPLALLLSPSVVKLKRHMSACLHALAAGQMPFLSRPPHEPLDILSCTPGLAGHPLDPTQLWHVWLLADQFYFSQHWSQKLHLNFKSVPLLMKNINMGIVYFFLLAFIILKIKVALIGCSWFQGVPQSAIKGCREQWTDGIDKSPAGSSPARVGS